MRMIGTIPGGEDAERFSDYLLTRQIPNMVEESAFGGGGGWTVWIENDDDLERGKTELDAFLKNPADDQYRAAGGAAERLRQREEKEQQRLRRKFVDVRTTWGQPQRWSAPLTLVLIALSVITTFASGSARVGPEREKLIDWLRFVSVDEPRVEQFIQHSDARSARDFQMKYWLDHLRRGQVWRLISPTFVHFSILHLLFNMFWLADLGTMIETRRKMWLLAALVLSCSILSNIAEFIWAGPSMPNFGGMSGVVYGLFGYVWVKGKLEPHLGLGVSQQTAVIMIAWMVLCMTGYVGNIANAAHVMGLVVGAAAAYLPVGIRRAKRRLR